MFCDPQKRHSCTYDPKQDQNRNNSLGSYNLLVSEMKMNGQESIHAESQHSERIEAQTNKMPVTKESGFIFCKFSPCCDFNRKVKLIM